MPDKRFAVTSVRLLGSSIGMMCCVLCSRLVAPAEIYLNRRFFFPLHAPRASGSKSTGVFQGPTPMLQSQCADHKGQSIHKGNEG